MEYGEPGPSVPLSQSPTLYRERAGSVAAGQANYESSSSSGVGNNPRSRERDSPPPIARSSTESSSQHPSNNYPPSVQLIRRDSLSDTREGTLEELVPTSFDESAIRVLCDMDVCTVIRPPIALAQFRTEWCSMHARSNQTEYGVL
jgi:hypothetical protein